MGKESGDSCIYLDHEITCCESSLCQAKSFVYIYTNIEFLSDSKAYETHMANEPWSTIQLNII